LSRGEWAGKRLREWLAHQLLGAYTAMIGAKG